MLTKSIGEDIKLPYKKYLDALVLANLQIEDISIKLTENGLAPFPKNMNKAVAAIMNEYATEYGKDPNNYPLDVRTMIHCIQKLPGGNLPEIRQAFEMLNDNSIRRWVNSMLMANIDPDLIYMLVSSKTDRIYDEGAYANYRTFFFNLEGFSMKDRMSVISDEKDPELVANYKIALEHDKERMLWKLGFTPDISVDELVKIVAVDSVMRFKATLDDDKAARLGTLVLRAADKLRELDYEKKKGLESIAGFDVNILRLTPNVKLLTDLNNDLEDE